jgi:ABC-2 type transport system permease protein
MKFGKIFRFEIGYQMRHVSTWLIFIFLFLFGFVVPRIGTPVDGSFQNSNSFIAFITVFAGTIWLLIGGVVAGDAATRDVQSRMYSMTYTSPTSKVSYLGGRFLAAFTLNALVQLAMMVGMLLSFYGPGARTELMGPFQPAAYLTAYGFVTLPNVFVITAMQFTVALLRKKAMASYIISVLILIACQIISTSLDRLLHWGKIEKMFDLLGMINIAGELETWTPYESNTRLIQLSGMLLASRLFWVSIASIVLASTYFWFRFAHVTEKSTRRNLFRFRKGVEISKSVNEGYHNLKPEIHDSPKFGIRTYVHQALTIAFTSFRLIALRRGGVIFVAVLAIGAALVSSEWMEWLGVPLLPRTEEVLRFLTPPLNDLKNLWVVMPFLTIVYAGELFWREREAGVSELSNTTPVPESILFAGQFLALVFTIIMWMTILLAGGILIQIMMGYDNFEIGVYVKALFGLQMVNYILFALLVLVVHVLLNQKYLGHMISLAVLLFLGFSSKFGIEHKLLVYGSDTGWSYSDMRGFDPFIGPWLWFKLYWMSWVFLLAVIAVLFWMRSKEGGFKNRFRLARDRFTRHKWAAATAVICISLTGAFIFYNTNILNEYTTSSERMEQRAEYERRYGRYEKRAQPQITDIKLQVDIYPDEHEAKIHGEYRLVNKSKVHIDSIHLATISIVDTKKIIFDPPAAQVLADEDLGHRIYALKQPLNPGDSLQISFEVAISSHGFRHSGPNTTIVANGTYFKGHELLPAIGFQENRRIRSEADRKKFGLTSRPEIPSLYDVEARQDNRYAEPVNFEAIVSTSADQTAIAPGTLRRNWTKDDRRYFHYVSNAPIENSYAIYAARYAVREVKWMPHYSKTDTLHHMRPVAIEIFHHGTHSENIDRMIQSAQASLKYYTEKFGPYPYDFFRVIERPGPGRGMHAEATTIDYMEGYSLMNPKTLDLPFHIMAHEVAHQWWAMQLTPAPVEGIGVMSESLATFSAMQVVEETLGHEHLRSYLRQVREEYETPRSRFAPPLLQANSSFMNYRKGPFALYAMTQYVSKDSVNKVLRDLLKEYPRGETPLPTTLDLYRKLQAITPDSLQYLVHDLFAANTYWQLKTEHVFAKQVDSSSWEVTIDVDARKLLVDSTAAEIDLPMNDWVQIGIFGEAEKGNEVNRSQYIRMHQVTSGQQTITVTVPWKPVRAGIDPNHLLIDLEMEDNMKKVSK